MSAAAEATEATESTAPRRGRGRPPGSPNKVKTAAKETAPRPPAADRPARRPTNDEKLKEHVAAQISSIGMGLMGVSAATRNPVLGADGLTVMEHADALAESLVAVSKTNTRVRKMLESGVESSAWLGVLIAVGALTRDIVSNHAQPAAVEGAPPAPETDLSRLAGQGLA